MKNILTCSGLYDMIIIANETRIDIKEVVMDKLFIIWLVVLMLCMLAVSGSLVTLVILEVLA